MSRGVFFTGTDTGAGKTVVARLAVTALARCGESVAVMKPVSAGCTDAGEGLRNDDAVALMAVSNVAADYEVVNPYALAPPVSPHLAAAEAGLEIKLKRITDCFDRLAARADRVVVEGVGGWYVPLSAHANVEDMALALDLPVVMVVGMRLGCLNHALLTERAIRASGASLRGWVANCPEPDDFRLHQCIETLKTRLHSPLLSVVPAISRAELDSAAGTNIAGRAGLEIAAAIGGPSPIP